MVIVIYKTCAHKKLEQGIRAAHRTVSLYYLLNILGDLIMEFAAEGQVLSELFQEIVRNVIKKNGPRR